MKLDSKVSVSVDLDINYALGKADSTPAYSAKLWVRHPSSCFLNPSSHPPPTANPTLPLTPQNLPLTPHLLQGVEKPLFSNCYPLNIPGLGPGPKPKDLKPTTEKPSPIVGARPKVAPSGSVPQANPSGGPLVPRAKGLFDGSSARIPKRQSIEDDEDKRSPLVVRKALGRRDEGEKAPYPTSAM